ncbi:MAG: sigma-54 dependent transcription regulator [Clostridia bacterium]|nr:sigma-54 dependent transcription regulator [Clostridia bacterium]
MKNISGRPGMSPLQRGKFMYSIGLISPYPKLADIAKDIIDIIDEPIDIKIGDMNEAIPIANKMISEGVEVIISRGGTALSLREFVDVPVIEIQITSIDIMKSIKKAKKKGNNIGLLGYDNVVYNIESIAEILDVNLVPVIFSKADRVEQKTEKVKQLIGKVDIVVGDHISIQIAQQYGIEGLLIESGKDSILESIIEAKKIRDATNRERERFEELKTILDYSHDGIISINNKGQIKFFNPAAEKIFNINKDSVIGYSIHDVLPHVNFKDVMKNGQSKIDEFYNIGEKIIIASTLPIKLRDKVAGVLSVFQDISKIQNTEEKIRKKVYLKGHVARYRFEDIITGNEKMNKLVEVAKLYANTSSNILLIGETGTGKEFFAQGIHNASNRRNKPFVAVNCAALPDNLLESELFGYEEGAFTGAKKGGKQGLFELAHGGTIFLDEIGEIAPHIQTRLLRVLQEKQVMRLGSDRVIPVDVRVIAATNKDLKKAIDDNLFREDLYYRLNVLTLKIPPLRERQDSIPLFVNAFIDRYCRQNNIDKKTISDEAMKALQAYKWYGNVRELENVIERLVIIVPTKRIELYHIKNFIDDWSEELQPLMQENNEYADISDTFKIRIDVHRSLKEIESDIIREVLQLTAGDRTKAAKILGIGRTTLWRWLNEAGYVSE